MNGEVPQRGERRVVRRAIDANDGCRNENHSCNHTREKHAPMSLSIDHGLSTLEMPARRLLVTLNSWASQSSIISLSSERTSKTPTLTSAGSSDFSEATRQSAM